MRDREPADVAQFTRWPGLLSLSLGVVLAPTVVLINQEAIYAGDMWACGHGVHAALHVVPILSLILVGGALFAAFVNWRACGRGVEDEHGGIAARTRFLAILGIGISVLSAMIVLAQWFGIFMYAPCMRA